MPDGRETGRIGDKYQLDYYRHPRPTRSWKWPGVVAGMLAATLGAVLFFGIWGKRAFQAAPVASVHAAFADDCRKCHDAAWQPVVRLISANDAVRSVSNGSCQRCHENTADHHWVAVEEPGDRPDAPNCAACHAEHRPEMDLVDVADAFCLSCHRDLSDQPAASGAFAPRMAGFSRGRDSHPEFAVLRRGGEPPPASHGAWQTAARVGDASGAEWRDAGGILFNHAVHLSASGVLGKDRTLKRLQCDNCHRPSPDGARMEPIEYERHCRECHPLKLTGELAGYGEAPHEAPALLRALFREKLASARPANRGESGQSAESPQVAESDLPRLLPKPPRITADEAAAIDVELDKLDHAVFGVEAKGFCRKCHHVEASDQSWVVLRTNPAVGGQSQRGEPRAIIPDQWFRHARFNHEKHRVVAQCVDCHQAEASTLTADLLLPSIDACRRCHGAEAESDIANAGDSCIECHRYHTSQGNPHPG